MTKNNCEISCGRYQPRSRRWRIDQDGRIWPCCYFYIAWQEQKNNSNNIESSYLLFQDKEFNDLLEKDYNWNSLEHHTYEEIITSYYYTDRLNPTNLQNHPVCIQACGKTIDSVTNNIVPKSKIVDVKINKE